MRVNTAAKSGVGRSSAMRVSVIFAGLGASRGMNSKRAVPTRKPAGSAAWSASQARCAARSGKVGGGGRHGENWARPRCGGKLYFFTENSYGNRGRECIKHSLPCRRGEPVSLRSSHSAAAGSGRVPLLTRNERRRSHRQGEGPAGGAAVHPGFSRVHLRHEVRRKLHGRPGPGGPHAGRRRHRVPRRGRNQRRGRARRRQGHHQGDGDLRPEARPSSTACGSRTRPRSPSSSRRSTRS